MVNRTTLTIKETQMRAFKRLKADHLLDTGEDVNNHQFFGILLESYQRLKNIEDRKKVDKLLKGGDNNDT